jgi:hypothetical protein
MSEYQYYEFLAIDRPLTKAQVNEVGHYSTRATITPTSFINEYNYGGGFRGNTDEFLTKYFDAMVYITNWGTHQFAFRVPKNLIDLKSIEPYCTDRILDVRPAGAFYIFDINLEEEEGGEWEEGSGYMASLAGIRAEVISGDRRPLFIAWLAALQLENVDMEEPMPPIPPGLRKLTASQQSLVDFLKIDHQLVRMVAALSTEAASVPAFDLGTALARISVADKDAWLKELIESDDPHAAMRIKLKLQAAVMPPPASVDAASTMRAGELLEKYRTRVRELDEQLLLQEEIKRKKVVASAAAAREEHLDRLAKNIPGAWRNIDQMIGLKSQEGYRQAVELMKDLRDLSRRPGGDAAGFQTQLSNRLADHARKGRFVEMVREAGLSG